jgi:hypothetical protein
MIEHTCIAEQVYLKSTPRQQKGEVSFDPSINYEGRREKIMSKYLVVQ